jgi:hypothetical protein
VEDRVNRPPLFRATFDPSELVIDSFAGGGGASTGIEAALGRPVDIAETLAIARRFCSLVRPSAEGECWEWQGARQKRRNGVLSYGTFNIGRAHRFLAHRLAWIITRGRLPRGVVRHACDNVACVRPTHLLEGTQAENLADMRERGRAYFNRFRTGAAHPNAKLDEARVREIRVLRDAGLSLAKIGARFGLNAATVHDIVRRRTWREVA